MSAEQSFLSELKRRNIFRVITAYAIASWVLLQLGDIILPALGLEDSAIRYLLVALLVVFPIVVLAAWFYELTPEGIKPTRQIVLAESITGKTGRRIDFAIIALLSVALVFFMSEYFSADSADEVAAVAIEEDMAAEEVDSRPSIAVLPLMNMSSDQENEHFSDGLTEELLNVLAQNQSLRVAGRTSSFFYKGKNINLKEIGDALDVEHVLEGSVRKSGDQVRITVQLINADDGFHIWSQTYDRRLTDIFAVQDEIARDVAGVMEVTLLEGSGAQPESRLTQNAEAYDLYLRARELLYLREKDSVLESIDLLRQVNRMDPGFAPPFVHLAEAYLVAENNHGSFELVEAGREAEQALASAAELGYESAEFWATKGLLHHHLSSLDQNNFDLAAEAYEKALTLNENLVTAYTWYSTLLSEESEGVPEVGGESLDQRALALTEQALRLDPLNRVVNLNYQIGLTAVGRFEEAEESLRRLAALDPEYPSYRETLTRLLMELGKFTEAAEVLAEMERYEGRTLFLVVGLLEAIGEESAVLWWADTLEETDWVSERIVQRAYAETAPLPEVVAQARLTLLQPDAEHLAGPYISRLMDEGEYRLVRQLLENMNPDFADETPRFSLTDGWIYPYIVVCHLTGDVERAAEIAQRKLKQNQYLQRLGFRGRGVGDVVLYVVLGRTEEAVIEYRAAWADGFRLFNDFNLDGNPLFEAIADDPRITEIQERMALYTAEHRPKVLMSLADAGILDGYPGLEPQEL